MSLFNNPEILQLISRLDSKADLRQGAANVLRQSSIGGTSAPLRIASKLGGFLTPKK
jgi:hypothetical protein